MQMVQIEQLIQGVFPYNNLSINCLIFNKSTQTSDDNKRIAKNSLLLYFRMLFMMEVSLYTSRVILNALGVEDKVASV